MAHTETHFSRKNGTMKKGNEKNMKAGSLSNGPFLSLTHVHRGSKIEVSQGNRHSKQQERFDDFSFSASEKEKSMKNITRKGNEKERKMFKKQIWNFLLVQRTQEKQKTKKMKHEKT